MLERTTYEPEPTYKYLFEPKEDITAYEMAQLLPLLIEAWTQRDHPYAASQKKIPSGLNRQIESLPTQRLRDNFKPL
ncbi:hypothetical protein [Microcoleus sp. herbarium14]|uniref:hypothetical protein n=1 Tax=Microcoleus sp. herbarium14 TaxID=3055439 RepID=UPI002FD17E4B